MKKTINYFTLKFSSNKIIGIFVGIVIFQFLLYVELINNQYQYTFYDLIIKQFNYLNLFYFLSFSFLLLLYNLCNSHNFYKYYHLKFKSKIQVYNINILTILVTSIIFDVGLNLIALIECIVHTSFKNQWSDYFLHNMTGNINLFFSEEIVKIITSTLSPLTYVIYTNIFVIFYLTFLGVLFLVINTYIKNRSVTFILEVIIISINMFIDSSQSIIGKLLFTYNIFFITTSYDQLKSGNYILYRVLYWLTIILVLYIIGVILTKRTDYRFEEVS